MKILDCFTSRLIKSKIFIETATLVLFFKLSFEQNEGLKGLFSYSLINKNLKTKELAYFRYFGKYKVLRFIESVKF